jgi:hypothetical protein
MERQPVGLTILPDGDVLAHGVFLNAGGTAVQNIARWNGSVWQAVGAGIGGPIRGTVMTPSGDLLVVGQFHTAGNAVSAYVTRLQTSCPAATTQLAAGCAGSGGSNTVSASLPWTGGVWTAVGTELPTVAIVVAVHGFATLSLPLAPLLPQGQAGCTLSVSPDHLGLELTSNGTVSTGFVLPNSPSLVGVVFHHQMIPFELGTNGDIVAITATNAVSMTVGTF